jgi:hypothetical protein
MTDPTKPATPAAAAAGIGAEITGAATSFISRVETELTTDIEDAWSWLKGELASLEPAVLADLKSAVSIAATDALAGGSSASIVSDTLTALARNGAAVLAQVKTDVVTAVVGLTTAKPTA